LNGDKDLICGLAMTESARKWHALNLADETPEISPMDGLLGAMPGRTDAFEDSEVAEAESEDESEAKDEAEAAEAKAKDEAEAAEAKEWTLVRNTRRRFTTADIVDLLKAGPKTAPEIVSELAGRGFLARPWSVRKALAAGSFRKTQHYWVNT